MTLKINKIPGEMPPLWNRRVIFFANILSLFYGNEAETDVLQEEVGAVETYGSRLIPLLDLVFQKKENVLVLQREPEETLLDYFSKDLHLTLPEIKIAPRSLYTAVDEGKNEEDAALTEFLSNLAGHRAEWIDGYVTDSVLKRLAGILNKKTISSPQGSRHGNNKLLLHQYIISQKIPTFDTYVAQNRDEVKNCLKELQAQGYREAVVKAAIGASGIGMKKINFAHSSHNQEGCLDIPDYLFFEGPCLVQGWLDESLEGLKYIGSPSVQMFIDDDSLNLHDITEQILSRNSVHQGNIAPPPYLMSDKATTEELLAQGQIAGTWLYDQGYRGTASTDFHIVERDGRREVRICEINARVTGATYPAILARHLNPQGSWMMRNIRFTPPIAGRKVTDALKKAGLLYQLGDPEGIFPFNFNQNTDGAVLKGQFLFLGRSIQDTFRLLEAISGMESLKGGYDRD